MTSLIRTTLRHDTSPRRLGRPLVVFFRRGHVQIFQHVHRIKRRWSSLQRWHHDQWDDDDDGRGSVRVLPLQHPSSAPGFIIVRGRRVFPRRQPLPWQRRRERRTQPPTVLVAHSRCPPLGAESTREQPRTPSNPTTPATRPSTACLTRTLTTTMAMMTTTMATTTMTITKMMTMAAMTTTTRRWQKQQQRQQSNNERTTHTSLT